MRNSGGRPAGQRAENGGKGMGIRKKGGNGKVFGNWKMRGKGKNLVEWEIEGIKWEME